MVLRSFLISCGVLMALFSVGSARATPLQLFVDADYTISAHAAQSIELGLRTALEEANYELGGHTVEVIPMDHRANVKRSLRTYVQYLKSEHALAIIGGMHSPPYLSHKDFLNENSVLTLLPWSAAGPITRADADQENWLFRLSVDDSQAGEFFVRQMENTNQCKRIAFVLLDTGWGQANFKSLTHALSQRDQAPTIAKFFPSGISDTAAALLAEEISGTSPDCAVLLSNWNDGATVVNALHSEKPDLRIFSHWGIMGGEFATAVPHQTRHDMNITVLQTCGLRQEAADNRVLKSALSRAMPDAQSLAEVPAPTGFVHGYDLGRVLIAAAQQAQAQPDWDTQNIDAMRGALRAALQALDTPVDGILKRYAPPFSAYSAEQRNGHEALGIEDLCLAKFRQDGRLEHAH